jgi:hypothetical protein
MQNSSRSHGTVDYFLGCLETGIPWRHPLGGVMLPPYQMWTDKGSKSWPGSNTRRCKANMAYAAPCRAQFRLHHTVAPRLQVNIPAS